MLNKRGMLSTAYHELTIIALTLTRDIQNKFSSELDKYQDTTLFKNHLTKLLHDVDGEIVRIRLENDKKIIDVLDAAARIASDLYATDFRYAN